MCNNSETGQDRMQRIFKLGDIQNISLTRDKELKI